MESIDRERFGQFVTELRKEKNFTQQELADRLFISNKAVSKWERGQSLPDIGLLTSLADLLGVTVTELLNGRRMTGETLETREADALVTKALQLSAQEGEKRRKNRRFWRLAWVVCAAAAVLEVLALVNLGVTAQELADTILLVEGLTLGFGAYFCFFAKETIPTYYDENRINFYSDGVFRMNIPGVHFNNSNWPHILNAGRGWLLGSAVLFPIVYFAARGVLPMGGMLALELLFCLSFFLPMIWAGKKYE